MVFCIVYSAIIGIDDSFRPSRLPAEGVNIALMVITARKDSLVVSEMVSADALAFCVFLKGAALPAELLGFLFGYEVLWQTPIDMNIERDVLF